MTKGPKDDDNNITYFRSSPNMDRRVVALVQFLARRAAEEDFYNQVIAPQREGSPKSGEEECP